MEGQQQRAEPPGHSCPSSEPTAGSPTGGLYIGQPTTCSLPHLPRPVAAGCLLRKLPAGRPGPGPAPRSRDTAENWERVCVQPLFSFLSPSGNFQRHQRGAVSPRRQSTGRETWAAESRLPRVLGYKRTCQQPAVTQLPQEQPLPQGSVWSCKAT